MYDAPLISTPTFSLNKQFAAPTRSGARPEARSGGKGPRLFVWLACAALLSACVAPGGTGSGGTGKGGAMSFIGGEIRIEPPAGYCIHPGASSDSSDGAVVLIGECAAKGAVIPAVISVTIGGEGSAAILQSGAKALSDYFMSRPGRAALARDGNPASVNVRQTALSGGALVMRMFDRQVGEYWRAVLGLRGRLVSVSVMAPETSSLSPEQSRTLLEKSITSIRAANGSTVKKPAAAAP
ncbi:hypothetical protein M3484_08535 [Pseudomonas sp. GX19020]|uniref:hypothetical protein n=1 Tax=Pseudomonas sp. GX19020 TaxID=2942277 RepID=UPI002019DEE2|nr:hypothetical protein [Pseudomonas sp. GX19020]MCL4066617.1 hypothetical protein [Pseudomonas sp. GX19020]